MSFSKSIIALALAFHSIPAYAANQTIQLKVSDTLPNNASRPINHEFPSLAWEKSSFASYAGNETHPNIFSESLVSILQSKVGAPLVIRIGGTSADQDHYTPNQTEAVKHPNPPIPNKGLWNYSIGPSYFPSLQHFNESKFIWMIAMAHETSDGGISADALMQTSLAIKNIGKEKLHSLELGNEPNLYPGQCLDNICMRGKNFDVGDYVSQALTHEKDVEANLSALLPQEGVKYQALAYASNVHHNEWNTSAALKDTNLNANKKVGAVSWHYYQSVQAPGVTLRHTLMNHSATVHGLSRFQPEISSLQSYNEKNNASIDFVLGEVGSLIAPELKNNTQSVFGAALWTVDAMMQAMSIGVSRMHMQSGLGFGYAPWNLTHVRAPYYGLAMVAQFIGNDTGSELKVKELEIGDETLSAYAAYQGNELSRIAILNMRQWNDTQSGNRPAQNFDLPVPSDVKSVRVQRLAGPGASSQDGASWDGVQWVKGANGAAVESSVRGKNATEVLTVSGGRVQVGVQDTEGVLLSMI